MEERNLVRKQAFELYLKRFPIIMLMMIIYVAITTSLNLLINAFNKSMGIPILQVVTSLITVYVFFQLLYGLNRTLLRINNGEKITNLVEFLKDAKSRLGAPLYCIIRIIITALIYVIAIVLIGSVAMSIARTAVPDNPQLMESLLKFTTIVALFVTIIKVIPYEFSFFILAEDNNKSISGKQALKRSKSLLKDHIIDYIILLLPIVGLFMIFVIIIALLDRFVSFSQNTILFYGVTILLEAFFTPIVRLVEINYYNLLNSGIDSDNK